MVDTAYQGEVMLLRWADNSTTNRTITLQLDEEVPVHPFKGFPTGKNGQRFMIVAVPINDEQMPDDDAMAKAEKKRFRDLPRSQQAGMLCTDHAFQDYLAVREGTFSGDSRNASSVVRRLCHVASRSELNTDKEAAKRWDNLVNEYEQRTGRLAEKR